MVVVLVPVKSVRVGSGEEARMGGEGMVVDKVDEARHENVSVSRGDEIGGETAIDDDAIASVAVMAAGEVEGVASLGTSSIRRTIVGAVGTGPAASGGAGVAQGAEEAIINLTLNVIYGYRISDIVTEIRKKVANRLLDLTGIATREINIEIADIEFPERASERQE